MTYSIYHKQPFVIQENGDAKLLFDVYVHSVLTELG